MLREKTNGWKIILASGSPRRQQFLKDLGLDFEIRLKEIEEVYPENLKASAITDFLAELKANAFKGDLQPGELLITSDTIVWFEDEALGKPKDYEDAFRMLWRMSGKTHQVITSVCFTTATGSETISEVTKVTFAPIPDAGIRYYLDHYKPFDKAGAYGIQDWIGLTAISCIEGSYTNVVGLPTEKVYDYLTKHFGRNV